MNADEFSMCGSKCFIHFNSPVSIKQWVDVHECWRALPCVHCLHTPTCKSLTVNEATNSCKLSPAGYPCHSFSLGDLPHMTPTNNSAVFTDMSYVFGSTIDHNSLPFICIVTERPFILLTLKLCVRKLAYLLGQYVHIQGYIWPIMMWSLP